MTRYKERSRPHADIDSEVDNNVMTKTSKRADTRRELASTYSINRALDLRAATECSIVEDISLKDGVASLSKSQCDAVLVRRQNMTGVLGKIEEYMSSAPVWPNTDDFHPLEATFDRVALIDFANVAVGQADPLGAACAYGRNLPPRSALPNATARMGVEEVVSVLPDGAVRSAVAQDAESLLLAVWEHTQVSHLQLRLELIRGDTCQKWHRDLNTLRCIVTYVGPGTHLAEETAVERGRNGEVLCVRDEDIGVKHAAAGDYVLMKGGLWPGKADRGAAHRAPPIGPVGVCRQHRLVLKVDIMGQ